MVIFHHFLLTFTRGYGQRIFGFYSPSCSTCWDDSRRPQTARRSSKGDTKRNSCKATAKRVHCSQGLDVCLMLVTQRFLSEQNNYIIYTGVSENSMCPQKAIGNICNSRTVSFKQWHLDAFHKRIQYQTHIAEATENPEIVRIKCPFLSTIFA